MLRVHSSTSVNLHYKAAIRVTSLAFIASTCALTFGPLMHWHDGLEAGGSSEVSIEPLECPAA